PRDPADPAYAWGPTDAYVQQAAAHGMLGRVMFTLWSTPRWAGAHVRHATTADMPNLRYWRDFVQACARRYSGRYIPPGATEPLPRVTAWETWNEPNAIFALRPQLAHGVAVSPRNYVKLLNALKREVRSAIPQRSTFVAGAFYKQGGSQGLTPVEFMRGMQAAGATFDVLSMHPYNRTATLGLRDGLRESTTNPSFIGIANLGTFISLANGIFHRRYPVWVTEFGWRTTSPGARRRSVTLRQQAIFARQAITHLRTLPQVQRAAWFLLRDDPPREAGDWYTSGLLRQNGARKPSFGAWRGAARHLPQSPIH
ncbi:MAG: glycosyl hydrolase, partial [Gaiellales bacterium]